MSLPVRPTRKLRVPGIHRRFVDACSCKRNSVCHRKVPRDVQNDDRAVGADCVEVIACEMATFSKLCVVVPPSTYPAVSGSGVPQSPLNIRDRGARWRPAISPSVSQAGVGRVNVRLDQPRDHSCAGEIEPTSFRSGVLPHVLSTSGGDNQASIEDERLYLG